MKSSPQYSSDWFEEFRTVKAGEYFIKEGVSERTASRDLSDLVSWGVLENPGTTGQSVTYTLRTRYNDISGTRHEAAISDTTKNFNSDNSQETEIDVLGKDTENTSDNIAVEQIMKDSHVNPSCPVHGGSGSGFTSDTRQITRHDTGHDNTQDKMMFSGSQHLLLEFLKKEMSRAELMRKLGLVSRKNFVSVYLEPLLNAELIERTIPDNPTSRNQLYRLTEKGRRLLQELKEKQ